MPQQLASAIEIMEVAILVVWIGISWTQRPSFLDSLAQRGALSFRWIRERLPVVAAGIDFSPCVAVLVLEVARHTLLSHVTLN